VLRFDVADRAARQRSVDRVVDLFFDVVGAAGVERFVEAGAKDAAASRRAATVPAVSEVVAFEANPYTYERFESAVSDAGVIYEHLALADRSGSVEINVRLHDDGSPIPDGQASLLWRDNHPAGHRGLAVTAVRLDDYFADRPNAATAVWMDVEGATSVVVAGAAELLQTVDVLMVEVEERPMWDGQQWCRREVVDAMRMCGLVPVARDRQARDQYNLVFVRRTRLHEPPISAVLDRYR
jgi:FkbM family methyltransferase